MYRSFALGLGLLALPGCFLLPQPRSNGSDAIDDGPFDTGDWYGRLGTYDADFEPATWSYIGGGSSASSDFQLSLTDRAGLTDCGLSADFEARPAFPARQIFVQFHDSNYQDCPDGLFTIGACDHDNQDVLGDQCARYRAWDADGEPVADLNASSGAMQVTDEGSSCRVEIELNFPGGSFVGERQIPYDGSEAGPFCAQ